MKQVCNAVYGKDIRSGYIGEETCPECGAKFHIWKYSPTGRVSQVSGGLCHRMDVTVTEKAYTDSYAKSEAVRRYTTNLLPQNEEDRRKETEYAKLGVLIEDEKQEAYVLRYLTAD